MNIQRFLEKKYPNFVYNFQLCATHCTEPRGKFWATQMLKPIVLTMVKTLLSFGHSECNRVSKTLDKIENSDLPSML